MSEGQYIINQIPTIDAQEKLKANAFLDLENNGSPVNSSEKIDTTQVGQDEITIPQGPQINPDYNKISFVQFVYLTNFFATSLILFYVLALYALIHNSIDGKQTIFAIYLCAYIIADILSIFSWIAFFYAALKKLSKLLQTCIIFLGIGAVLRVIGLVLYAKTDEYSQDYSKQKFNAIIGITSMAVFLNVMTFICYVLIKLKMDRMTQKEWKREFKKKKKYLKTYKKINHTPTGQ